ncbi:MAG TPA: PAS domain S-box protein [Syntrophales bacterium]|nr:PAS domain S-box protein [Syntrophales bacterium]
MILNRSKLDVLEEIADATEAFVLMFDHSREVVWMNAAFERCVGYRLEDLKQRNRLPFLSFDGEETFLFAVQQALEGDRSEVFELHVVSSHGIQRNIHWSVLPCPAAAGSEGRAAVAVGTGHGGPEQVKSDLEAAAERYRILFENTGIAMMFISEDTTISLVNKEFENLTGYPKARVEGTMSWTELIADAADLERMRMFHRLRRIDPDLAPGVYDTKIRKREGELRDVMLRVTMIPGTTNSLASILDMTERKRAERAVRESEEKFRTLVENMQDTLYRSDLDGNLVYVSPSGARLLGYDTIEELLGKNIAEDFYYDGDERAKLIQELQAKGRVSNYEVTLKKQDGSPVPVSTNTHFYRDGNGTPLGVEGIFSDITRQKRAEKALLENEKHLRSITMNMPGVVFQFYAQDDGEWGISYAGERLAELFNLPADAENFFPVFLSHIHEEDRERFLDSVRNAVATVSSWSFEGRFFSTSPHEITWFQGLATPTRHEGCYVFDGLLLNISERKHAEEMSRQSEEKFSTVFMTAPDCIAITRVENGRIVEANLGFEEITGWKRLEAVGRTSTEIHFWVDPADRDFMVEELKAGRDVLHREFTFRCKDGSERNGIYSARPIRLAGEPCLIFVLQDITDWKALEEDRRKLERQLFQSQKMDAIGQLAGGVAHDFNNILMGIQGNVSLLQMEHDPSHPHAKRLGRIEEHVKRGANLTRQLLGFAREGKYEVRTLAVNDLVRKSVQFFIETRKEIEADLELEADVHPVEADPGQLEQVLLNLYINAGHAMPRGGNLHIRTSNVVLREEDARAFETKAGSYVRISVSDTGVGMDRETLKRIFEPFFTTRSQEGGTGLGLASAYGIIRNHGGLIKAYSEPGRGSTFNVYLPSSEERVPAEDQGPSEDLLTGSGGILLVDDEPMILESASRMLGALGYTVYPAASGQDAVSMYMEKRDRIDLVILDMILPGISGAQVLRMLREIDPGVRVVLSSGYGLQGEVQKVMESGCRGFIQKPYSMKELSLSVQRALSPPGGRQERQEGRQQSPP